MGPSDKRSYLILFLALFAAYAWFHQGGGWNQNVRFDQTRALIETGSLAIDDYLLYGLEIRDDGIPDYRRVVLSDPSVSYQRLAWPNTFDLSVFEDRYYPNKPPGMTLQSAVAYGPIYWFERAVGIDPERWWNHALNAFLTGLISVALPSALGGVASFLLGRILFPQIRSNTLALATLAYGLGTPLLPYSTMMFDHAPVCAVSIAAVALLVAEKHRGNTEASRHSWRLSVAGGLAGWAVVLNHGAILIAGLLLVYVCLTKALQHRFPYFVFGATVPAFILIVYKTICFGDPLAFPEAYQLEFFKASSAVLMGSFELPRLHLVPDLLILPYRGLLFWSPILAVSAYGMFSMLRTRRIRAEAYLFAAIVLAYLVLNASFTRWHGGAGVSARYLIPAVPFLALCTIPAFERFRTTTISLALISVALMCLATSINPMVPGWYANPLTDFYLPLARGDILQEEFYPLRGPVSVNPVGFAGAGIEIYSSDSNFSAWNAFNLGEFIFPHSWASLLPLFAVEAILLKSLFSKSLRPERNR